MSRERADARLGRLLAIVPWVAAHDGPRVDEVCRRFGVEEKELVADLNLLFLCGIHPFTPDVLIDVHFDDGRVWISMADYFRRPLRLNPQEGLALASAAQAFLAVPGADPEGALATALEKLQTVLGVDGADEAFEVELGDVASDVLGTVRQAVDSRRKVRIDYYSFGRDGHSTRVVRPWRVFSATGHWYLSGWCESVEGERLFRVDRITQASLTADTFERGSDVTAGLPPVYNPASDDPVYVLDLDPPVHWIAEQYPNESIEGRPGGVLRVGIRSGQRAWLERLLLRAGPHLRVVTGDNVSGPGGRIEAAGPVPAPPGDSVTWPVVPTPEAGPDVEEALAPPATPPPRPVRRSGSRRALIEWGIIVIVAVLAALTLRAFVVQPYFIPSGSMEPTLDVNDKVLVNKLSYDFHSVHRGDIIVFKKPANDNVVGIKDLIKRVIGLPGETIWSGPNGEIFIDGKLISQPWLTAAAKANPGPAVPKQVIPRGEYYVMGDNRGDSSDSRVIGPISGKLIVGRAFLRVWPLSRLGTL